MIRRHRIGLTGAISIAMLAGCSSESPASASPVEQSLPFIGTWATNVADCDGGYDSLLLRADGSATGWEMSGSWRDKGDGRAEIHWTSEGLDEGGEAIDDRSLVSLSPDHTVLVLNELQLSRCASVTAAVGAEPLSSGQEAAASRLSAAGPDSFPLQSSYRFLGATLISLTGKGTSGAMAQGKVLAQDAAVYCDEDPGGDAAASGHQACIDSVLNREAGKTYAASANCLAGRVVAPWNTRYERRGGEWFDSSTGEDIASQGMITGSASVPAIFQMLCE